MRSIKPGRGPSFMGGVISIFMGLFGILWTAVVSSVGGGIFALFGVIFVIIAVVQAVYHFKNATGKHRHSVYDITDHTEEPDPLNERFGDNVSRDNTANSHEPNEKACFCPYCGTKAASDYTFCKSCGKKLP